jgi:6-phosphofructokinase 1
MIEPTAHDESLSDVTQADLRVSTLGEMRVRSPLTSGHARFIADDARVFAAGETCADAARSDATFEKAGPRERLFFDPARTRVGIVSCGGLCPGINTVIRSLVLELHHEYGVKEILGFRYGYEGLIPERGLPPMTLSPDSVRDIHGRGGSILGLGRGRQDPARTLDYLREREVDVLITIGGDGTLRGAHALALEAQRRGWPLGIVGLPKTIDNDIPFVDRTFGFDSAVEVAARALSAAHTEATSARNGIGVVKLMGREAGFIAAHAALASLDVNICLIPEVPFELHGLLRAVETRLAQRGHALIAVAEGCGLSLACAGAERDASGNLRFVSPELDIGPHLCGELRAYFRDRQLPVTLKYIDPSYMIRSVGANASDNRYCDLLARHAAHAAMTGKTDLVIGRCNGNFTHVPLALTTSRRKRVQANSELWRAVTSTTGQGLS